MSIDKIIVRAFIFICKTRKTVFFSEGWELFVAAGKKLMSIALMTYIPDKRIIRAVKNTVHGNCKFNYTKITCKVSAVFSNNINNSITDFFS